MLSLFHTRQSTKSQTVMSFAKKKRIYRKRFFLLAKKRANFTMGNMIKVGRMAEIITKCFKLAKCISYMETARYFFQLRRLKRPAEYEIKVVAQINKFCLILTVVLVAAVWWSIQTNIGNLLSDFRFCRPCAKIK